MHLTLKPALLKVYQLLRYLSTEFPLICINRKNFNLKVNVPREKSLAQKDGETHKFNLSFISQ